MKKIILKVGILSILALTFACQNFERPEMMLVSTDDPAFNGPLQRYWAFEGVATDSIWGSRAIAQGVSYVDGINGKALKGSKTAQLEYASAGKLASMESFTFAFWMNTAKHDGGAQSVFMLPNTEDFWGNAFMLIEGSTAKNDSMLVKFNFAGNWITFDGVNKANGLNKWPDAYNKWKHVAFTYDAATSKFATYVDGTKLSLDASVTDRTKDGKPLGALKMSNVSKFVLGAYQQHVGIKAPADGWMLHYTGLLDQFRVYTTALTEAEVKELYNNKK
ncbi:concanavalin A-like lectin/glucanase superfamily protein [Dyadobacter jejuensis]|uniref:Concanavalin A-like lectin/glucanase superfamily protein n=1 Tax=Dyadobacter jejuensis TaxID=1082580 RepID=A0A316APJ4_9BACT|nr:LamG domain-containing protein [Dyadobacter jejuensis]PWJ59633.1 concanavalin A-like lectin/glucanase superfamily protein [Dyadobacter jejuensis]